MNMKLDFTQNAKPDRIPYRFEVLDWEMTTRMLVTPSDWSKVLKGPHFEYTDVVFSCKLTLPAIQGIQLAEVAIGAEPQMEEKGVNFSSHNIGVLSIPRPDLLIVRCYVPQRLIDTVLAANKAGKIQHILVFGEKLIKPQALVHDLVMSTRFENTISFP